MVHLSNTECWVPSGIQGFGLGVFGSWMLFGEEKIKTKRNGDEGKLHGRIRIVAEFTELIISGLCAKVD